MIFLKEFLAVARLTNFSDDQVKYVFCMFLCVPLGLVFRTVLHPDRVSTTTRQATGLVWGLALAWFCFEWQTLILVAISGICYTLTCILHPSVVHSHVLLVGMLLLAVAHLYRQVTDYGGYSLDYTGPLMIFVQKISYVAFNVHDGMARDENKLTEHQRKERLKKVPSLLEYFSYLFHYSMILVGPLCTFKQFTNFINGADLRPKEPGQKEPSALRVVLEKLSSCLVCISVMLIGGSNFPIARNGDRDFIASNHFLWRVLYSWISIVIIRMRYYFAFKLAEAVNHICGLGFDGYDGSGRPKWDGITNVKIFKIELASSMKEVLDNWNICTALWLRRIVYDRVPRHRTLAVFVMSALWHGFYPGYYMGFLTCGLMVEGARKVRRMWRPRFQGSRVTALLYDAITCATTILCLTYTTVPFVALQLKIGLEYWRSMYYFGHALCLVAVLLFEGGQPRPTPREKAEQAIQETKEEKGESPKSRTGVDNKLESDADHGQTNQRSSIFVGAGSTFRDRFMWPLRSK